MRQGSTAGRSREPDAEITDVLPINAAFKTIQILGQVLRNFTGSLKGEPKRQLVEECYGLGLRMLGYIFKMVEDSLAGLARILSHQARSKGKELTEEETLIQVRRSSGLLQMITFNVFRHMSDSIGTEKVAQTLAEVSGGDDNRSIKVIELSIQLDHFEHFPRTQIEEAAREFSGNYFAMSLIRVMVWHHLYLYPVDYRYKQFACEKLHISLESQAKLVLPDSKKTTATFGAESEMARIRTSGARRRRRGKPRDAAGDAGVDSRHNTSGHV